MNRCPAKGCEREHGHTGKHMARAWDSANCAEILTEWTDAEWAEHAERMDERAEMERQATKDGE